MNAPVIACESIRFDGAALQIDRQIAFRRALVEEVLLDRIALVSSSDLEIAYAVMHEVFPVSADSPFPQTRA